MRIGLYTLSSRQGFYIGCRIAEVVSERCIERLLLTKHHKMKFHPVNYVCSLDFSVGLEFLLKNGFKVPEGDESAMSRVLSQFKACSHRYSCTCENSFTHQTLECIDLLVQYGYDFKVGLESDSQLSRYYDDAFSSITAKKPNSKVLSHFIELGAEPNLANTGSPHLVTALGRHVCKSRQTTYIGTYRRGGGRGRGRGRVTLILTFKILIKELRTKRFRILRLDLL